MPTFHTVSSTARNLAIVLCSLVLSACGGGGGAGSIDNPTSTTPPPAQKATVTVLLTDAPSDEFGAIYITVTSIKLLGDNPVVLFDGEETIDLLSLENFADLFAVADDVPAGQYSKIRLRISDLELVRFDTDGNVTESIHPDLPANGKLDLNPRGTFNIAPGENVLLQLDIDARRSIHLVGTGNGRYKFRPVVFVDILNGDRDGKAARVNGEIVLVDADNMRFEVCQRNPSSSQNDNDHQRHCVVVAAADSGFFDENADELAFADFVVGDAVTVIGRFSDGAENDRAFLEAVVIARGLKGTFQRFEGEVVTAPDATNRFDLLLDAGQGFIDNTTVAVQLLEGTGIADDERMLVAASEIQPGIEAEVEGVLVLSSTDPDTLRAIYVALDIDSDDDMDDADEIRISGQLLSIDDASGSLTLATVEGDRCVILTDDSRVIQIDSTTDASTTDAIALADIPADAQLDVYGEERVDGCFAASVVLVL